MANTISKANGSFPGIGEFPLGSYPNHRVWHRKYGHALSKKIHGSSGGIQFDTIETQPGKKIVFSHSPRIHRAECFSFGVKLGKPDAYQWIPP